VDRDVIEVMDSVDVEAGGGPAQFTRNLLPKLRRDQ